MPGHGRTTAVALVEAGALLAGMDAQVAEGGVDLRSVPDLLEAAGTEIAGLETVALQKGAGIHVAGRAHAAGQLGSTAQVESQPLALLCRQREEAVAGAHIAACGQPLGKCDQLSRSRAEGFPVFRPASGGTEAADPQRYAQGTGQIVHGRDLAGIVGGKDRIDTGRDPGGSQQLDGLYGGVEDTVTT